jgi:hypothetical protein
VLLLLGQLRVKLLELMTSMALLLRLLLVRLYLFLNMFLICIHLSTILLPFRSTRSFFLYSIKVILVNCHIFVIINCNYLNLLFMPGFTLPKDLIKSFQAEFH